ncbi:MAG: bifunctional nuclease family protein [Chlamydiota bacterium]
MTAELIKLSLKKVIQTQAYSILVLATAQKSFAIYTEPAIGQAIHNSLGGSSQLRPSTHNLLHMTVQGFNASVKQVIINNVQETLYFSRLFLEQPLENNKTHIIEIDARPSDSITLALAAQAPIFCTKHVLDHALPFYP